VVEAGNGVATTGGAWDSASIDWLIESLWAIRGEMLSLERDLAARIAAVHPTHRAGARNLVHYLALRRRDLRPIQEELSRIGLSSLGRAESHVLANLDKVLGILHRLEGRPWTSQSLDEPAGFGSGRRLLDRHARDLLGPAPHARGVRIMVTLPAEAAEDMELVRSLFAAGMDVARINCAHDTPEKWERMVRLLRRAAKESGRPCRILMDLAGPKLRTGAIEPGPAVIKWRPKRDALGRVTAKATIGLRAAGSDVRVEGADLTLNVDREWLAALEKDDVIELVDARGASRTLTVGRIRKGSAIVECARTAYVTAETVLTRKRGGAGPKETALHDVPARNQTLLLARGDKLLLTADGIGTPSTAEGAPATVACTLPEVFSQVKAGQPVWFDDGKIGGIVRRVRGDRLEIEITNAPEGGARLGADKGINFPGAPLDVAAMSAKDQADLRFAAEHADLVGLSFAQRPADVTSLLDGVAMHGAKRCGVVLKIETALGFENLPELLLTAMAHETVGIMIARGDLAVECGYERLAEVQEEMLWLAEAAHLPVIWATQVLETLAKRGQPSRAEITDAASGVRAECVMLNKGPHIVDAIRVLDDILRRMQAHQEKKRPLLRELRAWREGLAPKPPAAKSKHAKRRASV
jgi:pyruvate kinase